MKRHTTATLVAGGLVAAAALFLPIVGFTQSAPSHPDDHDLQQNALIASLQRTVTQQRDRTDALEARVAALTVTLANQEKATDLKIAQATRAPKGYVRAFSTLAIFKTLPPNYGVSYWAPY